MGQPRWSSTTATSSRSRAEPEHRADEVVARRPEEPRRAHDPARSRRRRLAVQLRPPVGRDAGSGGRTRRTASACAVEDVVGRERDERRAELGRVPRAADVHRRRALRIGLGAVHVRPGGGVQHEVGPRERRRARQRHVPVRPRQRVTSSAANSSASARPSWPPAPVIRTRRRVPFRQDRRSGAPEVDDARVVPRHRRARRARPGRTPRSRGSGTESVSASNPCAWRPGT